MKSLGIKSTARAYDETANIGYDEHIVTIVVRRKRLILADELEESLKIQVREKC